MKNLKFLFFSFLIAAFLAPNVVNAQALIRIPGTIAMDVTVIAQNGNPNHIVVYDAGRIVLTPSGNLQLKASFDISYFEGLVPEKGKQKITVARVAVRVLPKGGTPPTYHFEAFDVDAIVDSDGMAKVVVNWKADEMMAD